MEHANLTEAIIGGSMKVHRTLGSGFLESVYTNALALELSSRGLRIERERRLRVHYLTAIGLETGLPINFGDDELQFKRKARTYRPPRRKSE